MRIAIIGALSSSGSGVDGANLGPIAIRDQGLASGLQRQGHTIADFGNVQEGPERDRTTNPQLKNLETVVATTAALADLVETAIQDQRFPLILGGDHSISLGSVAAIARNRTLGLLWIDAHGDFNTAQTSPSGNIHGMPLAALCGIGDARLVDLVYAGPKINPQHVVLVGTRDLDPGEEALLQEHRVHVFPMQQIKEKGIDTILMQALAIAKTGTDGVMVSFDLDVVDPQDAPGAGTPVAGGISAQEAHQVMEILADAGLVALELVEVNPQQDPTHRTAKLAAELAWSACKQ